MDMAKGMTENVIYDLGKVASGAAVKLVYDRTVRVLKVKSLSLNKSTSKLRYSFQNIKLKAKVLKIMLGIIL